jgi:hypothetical protein
LAYLVSAVIIYYYSQKFYPIRYEWKKIISLGLILVSVFLLINILTKNIELQLRFIVRLLALLFYIAAPFFFGIFGAKEKEFLFSLTKKAFRRK